MKCQNVFRTVSVFFIMHEASLLTQLGDLNITRSGKQVARLTFNFLSGDLATLLLGMLGDATIRSSHRKSG
jgi:hypothetical protein